MAALWRGRGRATPPRLLPDGGLIKIFERLLPGDSEDQTGDVISGTGASAGQVTRPARASGVVTDVGGPLSHNSIVAREYGIPVVLGTPVGTRRIRDGQQIRVDGDAGTVELLDVADGG